jgi:outer membrane protein assembly factor BamB
MPLTPRLPRNVSRETSLLTVAALGLLALLAAACAGPRGPRGWAPAQPVVVGDHQVVLAPHKKTLYAVRTDSSFIQWQFPPQDRNNYPISQQSLAGLLAQIDSLDLSAEQKDDLESKAESLTVSGSSDDALKDALKANAPDDQRKQIETYIDDVRKAEAEALGDVKALYGAAALTEDGETTFVPAFGGWLFALETATGQLRWILPTDTLIGGVAIDGDTLYLGTKGEEVLAVNAEDGGVVWRFTTNGEVWSSPPWTECSTSSARTATNGGRSIPAALASPLILWWTATPSTSVRSIRSSTR